MAACDHHPAAGGEVVRGEVDHRRGDDADVDHVHAGGVERARQGGREPGAREATVASDDELRDALAAGDRAQPAPDRVRGRLGERLVDDAADVVGLEDLGSDGSHSWCSRKWKMRRGSHSMLPGKAPITKPTWTPRAGNSSMTADDTSHSVG